MRSIGVLLFLFAGVSTAFAQSDPGEAARRRVVVPYIRALTNCVAQVADADIDAVTAYSGGTLAVYLRQQLQHCPDQISTLLNEYDQIYGEGQGAQFIKGPYSADLERAVLNRIRTSLENKVEAQRQQRLQAEKQAIEDRERAQQQAQAEAAERERQEAQASAEAETRLAEAKQKAELEKAAELEAEANAKAAAAKAEAEKQGRLDDGRRAMVLLRDKYDDCAVKQLRALVKSGEAASVLASAVLTICQTNIENMTDAASGQWQIEQGRKPSSGEVDAIGSSVRDALRDRTTAYAVEAKAGAGPFSTAASN